MPLYARLWTDILDDPKLMRAVGEGAKHLVFLPWIIAFAKRADAEGRIEIAGFPAKPREIARSVPNATPRAIAKALVELTDMKVLTTDADGAYRFVAWDYRNSGKTSDSREAVAERVRKHRENKRHRRNEDVTPGNALQPVTDVTDVTSKRVESREERGESKRESRTNSGVVGKDPSPSRALRADVRALPKDVRNFLNTFWPASSTPREERIAKAREIVATLNGGATYRRHRIHAGSPERLARKCREVLDAPPRDPAKAMAVLFTKLGDVSDDSPTERAQADAKLDDARATGDGAHRLQLALAWLDTQPALATEISQLVDAGLPPGSMPAIVAIYRNAAISKAWRDAGEPRVQPAGGS